MIKNKHGQTLILFVILIPIMVLLCAFVIDTGLVIAEKHHLKEVTKTIIKEEFLNISDDNINNKINELFLKNEIDVSKLKINIAENKLEIKNEIAVASIFGNIIGIKSYKIKFDLMGYMNNDKLILE